MRRKVVDAAELERDHRPPLAIAPATLARHHPAPAVKHAPRHPRTLAVRADELAGAHGFASHDAASSRRASSSDPSAR